MAHHDLIDQLTAALNEGHGLGNVIMRAFSAGMDLAVVEAALETAQEIAAE